MTVSLFWLVIGLVWTVIAARMLLTAWGEMRANADGSGNGNGMLLIQRQSNVMLFAIALIGLICADGTGLLSLAPLLWPWLADLWLDNTTYRLVTTWLIILELNALGCISLHLWLTRRRLDAYWEFMQHEQRRRTDDPPPARER